MKNIFLIGLRGSGKTTVGRLLARHLRREFFDTDALISQEQGCTVAEVFHTRGEAAFRHLESQALAELCRNQTQAVIATGGGIVIDPINRERMRKHGLVFHLSAAPEILYQRIRADPDSDSLRPSLTGLTGLDDMRAIADKRSGMYSAARHHEIAVAECKPAEVVNAIVDLLPPEE